MQAVSQHGSSSDVLVAGALCVQCMCRNVDEAGAVVRSGALSAVLDGVIANPEAYADQVRAVLCCESYMHAHTYEAVIVHVVSRVSCSRCCDHFGMLSYASQHLKPCFLTWKCVYLYN